MAHGLDVAFELDYQGRHVIDASHIKGKLREACTELRLLGDDEMGALFGKEGEPEDQGFPAGLRFGSLRLAAKSERPRSGRVRTRIALNDRRVVTSGAMLVLEDVFPVGRDARWAGTMRFYATNEQAARDTAKRLVAGLRAIDAVGAEKSVGWGRVTKLGYHITMSPAMADSASATTEAEALSGTSCVLRIRPSDPLLVIEKRVRENFMRSQDTIPGSVVKGALAEALNAACGMPSRTPIDADNSGVAATLPALATSFGALIFRQARPAPAGGRRPVVVPLTAVAAESDSADVYDVALCSGPSLIGGLAPVFQTDWKDTEGPRQAHGWAIPKRVVKTRTAIDQQTRRARDGQLFSYEYVCPISGKGDPIEWVGEVDLASIEPDWRGAVLRDLQMALSLDLGIGKRRTDCAVTIGATESVGGVAVRDGLYIVTVQSPTLMVAPQDLQPGVDLRTAYESYWRSTLGEDVQLERFFAHQTMLGGYLSSRRVGGAVRSSYLPFIVTDAGSVFVLRADVAAADSVRERLVGLLGVGLPVPEWAEARYSVDGHPLWQTCPFVPANGAGEFSVNDPWFWERRLPESEGV